MMSVAVVQELGWRNAQSTTDFFNRVQRHVLRRVSEASKRADRNAEPLRESAVGQHPLRLPKFSLNRFRGIHV